ncbi:MAG TPA: phosphatase [Prolixibacteraceae bacterium]|nr:phosphatase [Prolixibacteraceae bacterium]
MDKRIAVIDLGTNTCNLLIAAYSCSGYHIVYQGKEGVKLGKGGIGKRMITEEGLQRAIKAIYRHQKVIARQDVSEVLIIATSAVRDAGNKDWFQKQIKEHTGLELQIISGDKEAELIFKGVKLAIGMIEDHTLILDIGGGSNEFILTEGGTAVWQESFPLGMARVVEQMPPSDPILESEIRQINHWFESQLCNLWERVRGLRISTLIGCAGAFDTIADLIDQTDAGAKARVRQEITLSDFNRIYQLLIASTTAERMQMKGMEPIRVEMIVPAMLFIHLIVEKLNLQRIYQTDFSLMEGVLYERISEL